MNRSGSWLAVRALENVGVRHTFGIPGVHNTELYDELDRSELITPVLVTHEGGGAFMADGLSRTGSSLGCLAIVPAAGVTHAMSGIGEAYLDGVPMLVISGGIRADTGRHYQLHDIDHLRLLDGITKAAFRVERLGEVVPTIYDACRIATGGEPGPVFVEVAADVLMATGVVEEPAPYSPPERPSPADPARIEVAARLLSGCRHPGVYVGWGARGAVAPIAAIAEHLGAPVATTMQGLSAFPADHPLHTGMGFGRSAVPAARNAFAGCDGLLAVGVRFAELATGSYGMKIPENLVHVDINPAVFDKNYPSAVAIEGDALAVAAALERALAATGDPPREATALRERIAGDKREFFASWTATPNPERVSPGVFFAALRERLARDAFLVVDDGNHTFLAAEQFPVLEPGRFLAPTDFNCMGYCVPAAIGAKLGNPDTQVAAVVGDGGFLMTGMEILTATTLGIGVPFFVFNDGELAQISQFQQIPLNRKTCTVLGSVRFDGIARATGAEYLRIEHDGQVDEALTRALAIADEGRPVVVDVNIDYSRTSAFTQGVVKTNLARFPLRQKLRFLGRAARRHLLG